MTQLYIKEPYPYLGCEACNQQGCTDCYRLTKVELLGVGEFADRCDPVLKKSTIYVYKSNGRLPEPDLMVNNNNTALWLGSTVDRWNEER